MFKQSGSQHLLRVTGQDTAWLSRNKKRCVQTDFASQYLLRQLKRRPKKEVTWKEFLQSSSLYIPPAVYPVCAQMCWQW